MSVGYLYLIYLTNINNYREQDILLLQAGIPLPTDHSSPFLIQISFLDLLALVDLKNNNLTPGNLDPVVSLQ